MTSTAVWDILARLGPEDALVAVKAPNTSGLATAGADWTIGKGPLDAKALHYTDVAEAQRFAAMVESDGCGGRGAGAVAAARAARLDPPRPAPAHPFLAPQLRKPHPPRPAVVAVPVLATGARDGAVQAVAPRAPGEAVHARVRRAPKVLHQAVRLWARARARARAGGGARARAHEPPRPHTQPCSARAIDVLCRPQFVSFAACLKGAAGDAAKCVPAWTAFDQCTENF
jgi:hypothetical protein